MKSYTVKEFAAHAAVDEKSAYNLMTFLRDVGLAEVSVRPRPKGTKGKGENVYSFDEANVVERMRGMLG